MKEPEQQRATIVTLRQLWVSMRESPVVRTRDWIWSVIAFVIAVYLNTLVQVILDDMGRTYYSYPAPATVAEHRSEYSVRPLADIGFALLPELTYREWINLSAPVLSVIFALALWIRTGRLFNGLFRHAVNQQTIVFTFRAFALSLTLLPPSLQSCNPVPNWVSSWTIVVRPFLVLAGQYATCYDSFFSGHAANLTLVLMGWFRWVLPSLSSHRPPHLNHHHHQQTELHHLTGSQTVHLAVPSLIRSAGPGSLREGKEEPPGSGCCHMILVGIIHMFYVVALLCIVMTRFHYTLDVTAGVCLAAFIFYGYLLHVHADDPFWV